MADKTAKKSTSSKTESSTAATTDSSSASDSSAPAEKASSGAASAGGSSAVHYGFFSNVKTPAYRSGWDSIWGKEDKKPESTGKPARRKPASGKAAEKGCCPEARHCRTHARGSAQRGPRRPD